VHGLAKFKIKIHTVSCPMTWVDLKVFDYKVLYRILPQYIIVCNIYSYH